MKSIPAIPSHVKTALISVSLMEVAVSVWKQMNLGGQDIISFFCCTCRYCYGIKSFFNWMRVIKITH